MKKEFYSGAKYLLQSKMVNNNLPLMRGSLKEQNCIDPDEITNPGPVYPLEIDRDQSECSVDPITG